MTGITASGEEKAWQILTTMSPSAVCKAALVTFASESSQYEVKSFGKDFTVSILDKKIYSRDEGSETFLKRIGDLFRLSLLWYLVGAKDILCTGRLVKLQDVKGGDIFTKGSHILPLDKVAARYGNNKEGFFERGKALGAEIMHYGDASLKLFPFPRIPVVLTLWLEDDEFPSRADLMFDSTCGLQIPTDIIWSIAMMSVLAML